MSAPSTLHVLDRTGDTMVEWDLDQPDQVTAAQELFAKAKDRAYLAYRVAGEDREVIREFDPTAPKIIMTSQMAGG